MGGGDTANQLTKKKNRIRESSLKSGPIISVCATHLYTVLICFYSGSEIKTFNYKYKCQGITWDIQRLYIFNFSQIILTELNIHLGNKLKCCIQWKTSYIVILSICQFCNSYLIQTKAQETGIIYSVMVEQLSFLTVICISSLLKFCS